MIRYGISGRDRAPCSRSHSPVAASARRSSSYKQGNTRASPTRRPTTSAPWNGNKRDWELALANRNQSQNEYKRIR